MIEVLQRAKESRPVRAVVAASLAGIALASCGGGDKSTTWEVGVVCPDSSGNIDIKSVSNARIPAVDIDCGTDTPVSLELLSGEGGTTVDDGSEFTGIVTIRTEHPTGFLVETDPRIELDAASDEKSVSFRGIDEVLSVEVSETQSESEN